jgi:hypothetical protein
MLGFSAGRLLDLGFVGAFNRPRASAEPREEQDPEEEHEDGDPHVDPQPEDVVGVVGAHQLDEDPPDGVAGYIEGEDLATAQVEPAVQADEEQRQQEAEDRLVEKGRMEDAGDDPRTVSPSSAAIRSTASTAPARSCSSVGRKARPAA